MEAVASILLERPGRAAQQVPGRVSPMAVWRKYGLLTQRFTGARTGEPQFAALPRETRFRLALEERGGTLAWFGQFLAGRADLLPSAYLRELNKIRPEKEAVALPTVDPELAGRISEAHPPRAEVGREVYTAAFQGRRVVVEVYRHGAYEASITRALDEMEREIRSLSDGPEGKIAKPRVLDHFREWLLLQGDIERKRSILENLEQHPSSSLCRYPRLVPELQSARCLVYESTDGTPLSLEAGPSAKSNRGGLRLVAEGLLDQSLFLSLVDSEMHLENYLALPDGRLGFRTVPSLAPVPVEWNYELLQYVACSVAGNSPRAIHMLSRISSNTDPYAGEQSLVRELSGLQPELKINQVTPESVTALENYWRALANTKMAAPLFLELFHRQWTLLGQYNGDIAPTSDLVAESLWPVVARILRLRFSEALSLEKGQEWASSAGLLFLGAARQVEMTLEQVRDNDLAMVVERQDHAGGESRLNRRTLALVRSGVALAVFLPALQLALSSREGMLQFAAGMTAVVAAVALSIFIARIE